MPEGTAEVIAPTYKIQVGLPAAMVRSYKQPLYDAETILAATPNSELVFFSKPVGQTMTNTTVKTELHTNSTQASMLPQPQSFDVFGFNVRLETVGSLLITKGNFDLVFGAALAKVKFATSQDWLTVPLEDIPAGVSEEGLAATDNPHIGTGISDNFYRFDVSHQSIHIGAGEHYSARVSFPSTLAGITGNLLLRWYIRGIQYMGL